MRKAIQLSFLILTFAISTTLLIVSPVGAQDDAITEIRDVRISPDGNKLLVDAHDGLYLYDSKMTLIRSVPNPNPNVRFVIGDWSPDSSQFTIGNQIWDAQKLQPIRTFSQLYGLPGWSADGKALFTLTDGGQKIGIVNADTGAIIHSIPTGQVIEYAKWSPDNSRFVTSSGTAIVVISVAEDKNTAIYIQPGPVGFVRWSPNGDRIAYTYWVPVASGIKGSFISNGTAYMHGLRIANATTGQILVEAKPITDDIINFIWLPDGNNIIGSTNTGKMNVWDSSNMQVIDSFATNGVVGNMAISPYGGRLIYPPHQLTPIEQATSVLPISSYPITTYLNGAISVIVPMPSSEKLQSITQLCGVQPSVQQSLTSQISTNKLQAFATQVSALNDSQILPGCRADLLAISNALMAKAK